MNGSQMLDIFNAKGMNASIHEFTSHFVNEDNTETTALGCYILLIDYGCLYDASTSEELRSNVIAYAQKKGSIAGMEYNASAFLDSEDDDFESEDTGLSWVAFDDLWNALEKTANTFNVQGV